MQGALQQPYYGTVFRVSEKDRGDARCDVQAKCEHHVIMYQKTALGELWVLTP